MTGFLDSLKSLANKMLGDRKKSPQQEWIWVGEGSHPMEGME